MVEEILREAITFYGPGQCTECGELLTVVDHEMTIMELNKEGHPLSEETIIKAKACCPRCGHKRNMMRWKGTYVPDTDHAKLFMIADAQAEIEKRRAQDKFIENPLAL